MSATSTATPPVPRFDPPAARATLPEARKLNPVKWWAGAGVVSLAIWAYVWIRWLTTTSFKATPTGTTAVPGWMHVSLIAQTVGFVAVFVFCLWLFVIKPYRRDGRLSTDGLMYIAVCCIYWQDPLSNIFRNSFVYNADLPNFGSWANFLPGWFQPNGQHFPEPVYYIFPVYALFMLPPLLWGCWAMRKAKTRWPRLGTLGVVGVGFAFYWLLDLVIEVPWLHTGLYAYPGPIKSLTLFYGHYYQFPLYEGVLFAACWLAFCCVRYFKNDKGETLVERGIDRIKTTPRRKTLIRFLALVGVFNVLYLVVYNVPMAVSTLYGSSWPRDVVKRTYFDDGLCGPGTGRACPASTLPLAHGSSGYVNTSGRLVGVDPGQVLARNAPAAQR